MKLTTILIQILKEEQDGEDFSKDASSVDDVLGRYKILKLVLTDLLTSNNPGDLDSLLDSISVVSYKPTTFKITFKNGGTMNLKYDPTPMQTDPQKKVDFKPKDYFKLQIAGKKYSLQNRSEYLQALEYIEDAMEKAPIGTGNNQSNQDQDTGDTGNDDEEPQDNDEE